MAANIPRLTESFDREHLELLTSTLARKVEQLEQANQAAAGALAELETVLGSMAEGLILCDAQGCIQRFNAAAVSIHGLPPGLYSHRPLREFDRLFEVHDLQGNRVPFERWPVLRAVAGETFTECELRVRHVESGYEFIGSYSGRPMKDASGRTRQAIVTVRDVTRRKRTEQAGLGFGWLDAVHPDDRRQTSDILQRANQRQVSFRLDYRLLRADGQYRWAMDAGRPHFDNDGTFQGFVGAVIDITERKYAEEELAAAKASAERAKAIAVQANSAKDHFLAVLSHELRTPLTPVVMGVSMLQKRPDIDPAMGETLEVIRRNVDMEARLIDDLLDVTRIARGKIELSRGPVELCTVIQRAAEVCKPDFEARGLHFGADFGPAAPYWVEGDVSRLQQVFWNLLKNAIKFSPHGGCVGIRCRLEEGRAQGSEGRVQGSGVRVQDLGMPGTEAGEGQPVDEGSGFRVQDSEAGASPNPEPQTLNPYVVVDVNDSGIGIEPEALLRVFDAFEQAERSITRQFGGLGLGLAISKALVEMHGGTIEAISEGRGKGATFRIRLPRIAPPNQAESRVPAAPARRAARPLRILLVEDHGVTAKMMRMVLTEEGHTVETAGDVATALELAGRHSFDLLLSDLGLPDGSGHDLMRELRLRGHRFPGIALSGYGQEEDIQRSHRAGFAAHLTKPASREAVVEAVAAVAAE